MKPYKSFIFLILVLTFTAGICVFFIPERFSDFNFFSGGFGSSFSSNFSGGFSIWRGGECSSWHGIFGNGRNEKGTTADNNDFLAELKKRESAIAEINAQYSVNPAIFAFDDLHSIPFESFVYDTSAVGDNRGTNAGNAGDNNNKNVSSAYVVNNGNANADNSKGVSVGNSVRNPLEELYRSLLFIHQNPQLLRFLHYGDEQIENDKITKTFRKLLQRAFGGSGNGIIPIFQSDYLGGISVKLSDNWSVMSMQKNQRRGNYGLCNAYLYPPAINALITSLNVEKGMVEVRGISYSSNGGKGNNNNGNGADGSSNDGGSVRATNAGDGLFLEALLHEDVWIERDLQIAALTGAGDNKTANMTGDRTANKTIGGLVGKTATNTAQGKTGSTANNSGMRLGAPVKQENFYGLQHCIWQLPDSTTGINISLSLLKNRNIYALSINSGTGIIVDNISLRGSAGNIFLKNNRRFLTDNYALMNVRLVIYQFKTPPQSAMQGQDFYKTMLEQELGYLRITVPDVPIIVIGNSSVLRKIALEKGCVFWNLRESNNAELAGKMLYKAFVNDYKNFIIKERDKKIRDIYD